MENTLWKILAFLLCAILLFLAPLMSILERQDDIAYNVVLTECNRFVDTCRDLGYITPNIYLELTERLNSTGNMYDIKLSHISRTVDPVYVENGSSLVFTGEYEVHHVAFGESQILSVLFPEDNTLPAYHKDRRYLMSMGDLLFIEVKNRGKTMAQALRDMILFTDTQSPSIFVRAGGMVRNEAY
ncbi:MAG: hypothetical protein GXX10_06880 [Clostridiaceae bacterium]|nr:hypothetical protein [Clostridiaceae bacterium]